MSSSKTMGWIGVDLDGTLATYHGWAGPTIIGDPIPMMVNTIQELRSSGMVVKIFTARVAVDSPTTRTMVEQVIEAWCLKHADAAGRDNPDLFRSIVPNPFKL